MGDGISPAPADYQPELDCGVAMRFEGDAPIAKRGIAWALVVVAACLFGTMGVSSGWHLRLVPTLMVAVLGLFAFLGAAGTPKKPSKKPHRVHADAHGLSFDGALYMPRGSITSAYGAATDDGLYAVHVEGGFLRRACVVYLDSEKQGGDLLAALHADSSSSAAHFRALPPWAKHIRWLAILLTTSPWVLINLLRHIPAWGVMLLASLYGVLLLPTFLPQRVDVGHDGVFLRWLGNKRFLPFAAIETVIATKLGVDVFLRDGRHVEIRLTQKDGGADAQVKALVARINEGIAAQSDLTRADEEAFLARTGRDLETWLRDMRALGAGEMGGYRSPSIPRERLWAVVENPAADPSAREGAALALHATLDADERARLATLAQKTAQPRLRVALDGVSRERVMTRLRVALEAAESAEGELDEPDDPAAHAKSRAKPGQV
jgi:hypothetical protein